MSRRDALFLSPAEGPGDDLFEAQLDDPDGAELTVEVVLEESRAALAAEAEPPAAADEPVVEAAPEAAPEVGEPAAERDPVVAAAPVTTSAAPTEGEVDVPEVAEAAASGEADANVASRAMDAASALEAQLAEPATEVETTETPEPTEPSLETEKAEKAEKAAKAKKTKKAKKAAEAARATEAERHTETETVTAAETATETETTGEAGAASEAEAAVPVRPFDAAPASLRGALEGRGFEELSLVQQAVLASEADGRDLQISSQTGSGKTIALGFVLARVLENCREPGPLALVIVPTRELANQVCEELGWLFADLEGVVVGSVVGGNPVWRDRQLLSRRPRVLVGTPGRLLDHVSSKTLDLSHVQELVLDEADQMLDMGFREELEGILDATPTERHTHMVSATFPDGIQRLAERYQRDPLSIEGTRLGDANADIEHRGHLIHQRDRFGTLVNLLLEAGDVRTLIFVERRADTLEVAEKLEAEGFAALPLSGELAQSQRERTLAAFRAGRASVLVATDVAARGLDVPDVRLVIHTAPPLDAETYTHRSGRTGRAGQSGSSVLLAAPSRRRRVGRLMNEAGIEFRWQPVPTANEVRALVQERHRGALAAELEAALAAGASEAHGEQAEALLADHEPRALVAALLGKLEPAHRAEPRDVEALRVREERGRDGGRHERPSYGDRDGRGRGGDRGQRPWDGGRRDARDGGERYGNRERYNQRDRQDRGPRRGPDAPGEFVRFFINWGENQGASPGRVLATACRRGDVTGSDIGSIAVHPNASTFDVHASVAERFEDLASRRDRRDPKTMIRRDRGPRPGGPRPGVRRGGRD